MDRFAIYVFCFEKLMNFMFLWGAAVLLVLWMILRSMRPSKSNDLSWAYKIASPMANSDRSLAEGVSSPKDLYRKTKPKYASGPPPANNQRAFLGKQYSREYLENLLSVIAIMGDFSMILLGFILANLFCQSYLKPPFVQGVPMPSLINCYNIILAGSVIILWGLTGKQLYSYKNLLSPSKIWHKLLEPLILYFLAFIGFGQVARYEPQIPWFFFACAAIFIFLNIYNLRLVLSRIIRLPSVSSRLRRRLVVIGGGSQTWRFQKALGENNDVEFVGWVQANKPNHVAELEEYRLGSLHELGAILKINAINVAVLTESDSLQREGVLAVAKACEQEHVQFKMVPHFFEILISGLRSENIAGAQLLGVETLPLGGFRNQFLKRSVDIIGSMIGLLLAVPLIAVFGLLVYLESPGPILYKQLRQGRSGRLFYIVKIRSMRVNAEAGGKPQWAQQNDPRRLRVGTFIRKFNIDEVPQFWNVLIGQMSLVGPRPERPELIARFKSRIPHYQSRHMCQPGITGWAQVNGWRGNTDLEERIRHDIWYLENWSLWLDFRIMLQTFYRRDNAY
jgi:exopolysaccharide biosynthesis polyprenyl glycosylphosphotransferase